MRNRWRSWLCVSVADSRDAAGLGRLHPFMSWRSPILERVPQRELQLLLAGASPRVLLAGQILFHAGDRGDSFYLIESGAIELFDESDAALEVVTRLGPGEAFGEQALRPGGDSVRTLGARAATTVHLAE